MTALARILGALAIVAVASPAAAQIGTIKKAVQKGLQESKEGLEKSKDVMVDLAKVEITDEEEQDLGAKVSAQLREKYGVVQNKAVHKYVALVGTVLARASSRPNLKWTFVVLDTDGVNAFAAPGGYVHVTRGALGLIQNESELAGVLAHEISHITLKHTIEAIKKSKRVEKIAGTTRVALITMLADKVYETVFENVYDRGDEKEADRDGVRLANQARYAPAGLTGFLTHLTERNKGLNDRSGLFASHPETKDRIEEMQKVIETEKLTAKAVVASRYRQSIPYKAVPVGEVAIAAGAEGTHNALPAEEPKVEKKAGPKADNSKSSGGKFGLSKLTKLGQEKPSTQTVASSGSRGVNPDRDAKGGPIKTLVPVTVTAAELTGFRKGIA